MSQTVIGFFDNASDARRAKEKLRERGVGDDHIDISGSQGTGNPANVSTSDRDHNTVRNTDDGRTVDAEGRNTNKITDFFNSLFQGGDKDDDDDAGRYRHVAERVNSIVTVHASTPAEAEAAAEIMDDCGAVDVNERASQTGYTARNINRMTEQRNIGNTGNNWRSRIIQRPVQNQYRLRDDNYENQSRLYPDDQAH